MKRTKKLAYNYLDDYLNQLLAKGRYSVSLDELRDQFNSSEKAILQNIYRLKRKQQLAQVRKEFYVIISPQYSRQGMIPPTLFISDLMEFLNREYYVGLFSAAALHGAGHQQPMEFQVIIKKPAFRNILNEKLAIRFFTKSRWDKNQIIKKKTETGYIKVSSPELTAFDLVYYHKKVGGLNRVAIILADLTESMDSTALRKAASTQSNSNGQRLGFILEELGAIDLANSLHKEINKNPLNEIPLSLAHRNRQGQIIKDWKVRINTELDF